MTSDAGVDPHRTATPVAFVDDGLGNSSYLVELGDGRALVVDPARHPAGYLAEADRRGLDIAYAVETHLHADFVSGARELGALGASLLVPIAGGHEFPVRGLGDGEDVDLGGLTLRPLATPGHTPEHLAYLLLDGAVNAELGDILDAEMPRGPVSVMCAHGERAMTGASLLARAGHTDVTVLIGGPEDWARDHGPLETGA